VKSPSKAAKTIKGWDCDGLRISVRGSTFHAVGTLRVGKQSRRVRETLGVVAAKENRSEAERQAREIVRRVRAELGGGVTRRAVATLVAERFKAQIGPSDRRILEDFTAKFTTRILWDIPAEEIIQFVEDRQRGNKAETRERYISQLCAFLNLQIPKGQYPALPAFKRDQKARNPLKRARRDVQQFRVQLLEDIIAVSHISLCVPLQIEYAAGARVSSLLQGCTLGDLDMTTLTLTFRDTKNGDDVPVALPTSMRPALEDYLEWRQLQVRRGRIGPGSHELLFLHYKGRPYKPNGGAWGTQNKTAFNNAKRRAVDVVGKRYDEAIAAMRLAGDRREVERLMRLKADDLTLLRRITQHWLRHKFATEAGRKDMRAAMAQGGWRDPRSINGYLIADADFQRAIVEERGSPAIAARGA
jgi:site-specific recombinase XerD